MQKLKLIMMYNDKIIVSTYLVLINEYITI
jgi:hypothetical protein